MELETKSIFFKKTLSLLERSKLGLYALDGIVAQEKVKDERLRVRVGDSMYDNPVMVGAGWDKTGVTVRALWRAGFAGVEIGSVSRDAQPGNLRPRFFELGKGVYLNRFGFNTPGMETVARNLEKYRLSGIPIGISIGKNKNVAMGDAPEAHAAVVRCLYDHASYFAINVSSLNTPGLRTLQEKKPLTGIVQAVTAAMREKGKVKPFFIKIAPDLTREAIDDVVEVALAHGVTGIIATNTTNNTDLKAKYGVRWKEEAGGLSGDDENFRKIATKTVAHIFKAVGNKLVIIGAGGVKDAATVLEKIKAGATIVQVVSALYREGPAVAGRINRGLVEWMEKEGVSKLIDMRGIEAEKHI